MAIPAMGESEEMTQFMEQRFFKAAAQHIRVGRVPVIVRPQSVQGDNGRPTFELREAEYMGQNRDKEVFLGEGQQATTGMGYLLPEFIQDNLGVVLVPKGMMGVARFLELNQATAGETPPAGDLKFQMFPEVLIQVPESYQLNLDLGHVTVCPE